MRIVFVLAGLGAGGAEKVVNLLARHRLAQNDSVHVIAVNAKTPDSYFPYDPEIEILALGADPSSFRFLDPGLRLAELRKRLRDLKPDVIVSFLTKINVLTALASRGLDAAVLLSERNNYLEQKMSPVWRWAGLVTARRATALVMQTENARAALPASLQRSAIVIPNPIASPPHRRDSGHGDSDIVAAGRLERQKGFDLLIEAFGKIAAEFSKTRLTIYGEGLERPALERRVRELALDDRISLPGVTGSPGDWVSAGGIFVLSSRFEGFPNVLLEAMAAGLATVAMDCPWGPSEIIEDGKTGLLAKAGDTDALAAALRRLLENPDLRGKLAEAAPAGVSRFAESAVLAQWDRAIDAAAFSVSERADAPASPLASS